MCVSTGGELFMQLEREGIFMEDTAWWVYWIINIISDLYLNYFGRAYGRDIFMTKIWKRLSIKVLCYKSGF